MDYDFNLGVWQNDHCIRCGGCCYVCGVWKKDFNKKRDSFCPHHKINQTDNITSCSLHGSRDQPKLCINYFCGVKPGREHGMDFYERLLVVRAVIDVLGINPVSNSSEIRDFLEKRARDILEKKAKSLLDYID